MIHVPMEAQKNVDTAPDVLTTRMSEKEIQERLKIMLEKFENVRGINNHMGSKLTEDEKKNGSGYAGFEKRRSVFPRFKNFAEIPSERGCRQSKRRIRPSTRFSRQ